MLISQAFDAYVSDVITFTNRSAKTEEHYGVTRNSLINYLGESFAIEQLSMKEVRGWKLSMDKRNLAESTIRGYLINLRVVLGYLRREGVVCLAPEAIELPKRSPFVPAFITPVEVKLLIKTMARRRRGYPLINRVRNQAIISMLYGSGLRIGECCALNRDSIYQKTFSVIGKGKKARLCFIDARTEKLLRQYLALRTDNHPALFLSNQTGGRIKPGTVRKIMAATWKDAGFTKPIHPHTLRHSFATDLLRNNANPRYVQALLGHSSLETTQMYMSVVDNDLKAAYERYHSV